MTQIKPFNAVIYNQEKIKDLANVTCPPYDVIPPAAQEYYHSVNPYNFIHILLGKDIPGEDKYQRSANYFRVWLKDNILIREEKPAIYFYSQQYNIRAEKKIRHGFISLLHLGEVDSGIFCHENTRVEPKEDRLRLLRKVKANLSPIFVLFADRKRIMHWLSQQYIKDKKPFIGLTDNEGILHKAWRIDSPEVIAKIQESMKKENVFIADGHHRYEAACAYRDEMKEKTGTTTGEEDFNYIMAYFTNLDPLGLTILPIHRLVKVKPGFDSEKLFSEVKDYFNVDYVKDKIKFFFLLQKAGTIEHVLGMYQDKKYWLLRLRNIKIVDKLISAHPPAARALDISILNHIILKDALGLNLEDKENITFSPNAEELIERADENNNYAAFFLNGVKVKQIISVALNNGKMPTKSTYFYPKVLSGLVINKHE